MDMLRPLWQADKKYQGCEAAVEECPRRKPTQEKLFPGAFRLDGIPDLCRHARAAEPRDGADAGRRGDVDLRSS
jgi:hypothetical protein